MQNTFTWSASKGYNSLIKQCGYPTYPYPQGAMNCWKKSKTAIIQSTVNSSNLCRLFYQHITRWVFSGLPTPSSGTSDEIGLPSSLSCFLLLLAKLLLSRFIFFPPQKNTLLSDFLVSFSYFSNCRFSSVSLLTLTHTVTLLHTAPV